MRKTSSLFLTCMAAVLGADSTLAQTPPDAPASDERFCARAQALVAGTTRPTRVTVHEDYESFKESKAAIRPLEIHQYVLREEGTGRGAMRISCKLKSADQILEVYGAGAARPPDRSCADVNRATADAVYGSLGREEGARIAIPRERLHFDEDDNRLMGSRWVESYPFVYRSDRGLHLAARSLHIDWTDVRFAWAPDRLRGVHYCHLIAPEYLRRLILGEVQASARETESAGG
jgi:hypothetical protein